MEKNSNKRKVWCRKETYKNFGVDVDNTAMSKLGKIKTTCKYLIEYLDKGIRPLVLIMP